jgi:hypothetical protein
MQTESRVSGRQLLRSFIIALVSGFAFACVALTVFSFIPGLDYTAFAGSHPRVLLVWGLSCFLGGVASGGVMESALRKRRWRFLYLAASSPGMFLWCWAVVCLLAGEEPRAPGLAQVLVGCLSAFAGAALGYTLVQRRRASYREKGETTGGHGRFAAAFALGVVVTCLTFVICLICVVSLMVGISPGTEEEDFILNVGIILQFALPSLAGGFASGWMLQPGLEKRRWRFLYLCAASPATAVWFIAILSMLLGVEPSTFGLGIEAPGVVGLTCISAVVGSLFSYRVRSRSRTRRSRTPSEPEE